MPFSIASGESLLTCFRRAYPVVVSRRAVDSQVTKRKRYPLCPPRFDSYDSSAANFRIARHPPKDDYEAAEDSNVVRANGQIKKLLRRVRYHF
jgi:hypothetical protein